MIPHGPDEVLHIGFLLQLYHARFQYDPKMLSVDNAFAVSAEHATPVLFLLAMLAILISGFARTSRATEMRRRVSVVEVGGRRRSLRLSPGGVTAHLLKNMV